MKIKLFSKCSDPTFSVSGFCTWKNATRRFEKHEGSNSHKKSRLKWEAYVKRKNVAALLNDKVSADQTANRAMLLKILSTLQFLCRQGLAIRGNESASGNFHQ